MKAFPDMKSRENDKTLTEFKKHFHLDKPEQNKTDVQRAAVDAEMEKT